MEIIRFLGARLREPSSHGGITAMLLLFGVNPGMVDPVAQVIGGVFALASVLLPEGKASNESK